MRWPLLSLLLLAGCDNQPPPVVVEPLQLRVADFGLYDIEVTGRTEADYTPSGHLSQVEADHRQRTRKVPMVAGQAFGFEFDLHGEPFEGERTLAFTLQHPPMTEPDGEMSEGFTHVITIKADALPVHERFLFTFSEPFEMVPGHWLMTIHEGEQELARQPFEVVAAAAR